MSRVPFKAIARLLDNADWKEKYRESLQEIELEEQQRRQAETILRRLVGRLCAARMGSDAHLDAEFAQLAAATRNGAEPEELERIAVAMTGAMVAVDAAAAISAAPNIPAASARCAASCAAAAALLKSLDLAAPESDALQVLMAELPLIAVDAELAGILRRATELLLARRDQLARDRLQAAAVLSGVKQRLEEMAAYLTTSTGANRARLEDTQILNDTVMLQVRELTQDAIGAVDLGQLQSLVSERLESVAKQVDDFRAREQLRLLEDDGRSQHMRARIADLERESRDLHSKLDRERHGARLDPLTSVANRRSFDERFAHEIAHSSDAGAPLALLLWDIDDFKSINDQYGHRAGDRVLQSVAGCLASQVRSGDLVARIGGEEFGILLAGLALEPATRIANHLRAAVEALSFHFRGTPVRVTVSCGFTILLPLEAAETVFDRADAALYRAKRGGKNLCIAA